MRHRLMAVAMCMGFGAVPVEVMFVLVVRIVAMTVVVIQFFVAPQRFGAALRWSNEWWRASLGAMRYAKQDDVAENESPTDGYTLVDAHLAYHVDVADMGWEFFVDGTNLTNQSARVHTSFLKDVVQLPGRGVSAGVRVFF